MGDGELNEGSVWEAALFASHHKLDNLVVIIDRNRLQALGSGSEIMNLEPLAEKWASFGWAVKEIDADPGRVGLAGSATKVIKVFFPQRVHRSEIFQGDLESQTECLIGKLRDAGLV